MQRQAEGRFRALMRRCFVEREFYLRVDGRVRYLRVGSRIQMLAAATLMTAGLWVSYASFKAVLHESIVDSKDRQIEQSRLAYVDLLQQINDYHAQYARVIESLEDNQAFLLNLMEDERADVLDQEEIERRVARSNAARDRIVAARGDIDRLLKQALQDASGEGDVGQQIEDQIAQIRSLLEVTEAERTQIKKARDRIADQLSSVKEDLKSTETSKRGLEATVSRLQSELGKTKADRTQLSAAQLALSVQMGRLQANLLNAREREAQLEGEVLELESDMDQAVALGSDLTEERDQLLGQVTGLEARLVSLQENQHGVVARLTTQTRESIGVLESAIETAGLNPDKLLARMPRGAGGQGGPFVPAQGGNEVADHPPQEFSIASLDAHMNRWEALQQVMGSLPLAAPVDDYRLTRGFGVRRDPINGRRARHNGLDFAAPIGAHVLATAPGKIVYAGWYGRYGRMVEVDHGYGIRTRVAHMRKIYVKVGQKVAFRDKLGMQGSSGRSNGPHVHYEIHVDGKVVDPMNFIKAGRNVFKG